MPKLIDALTRMIIRRIVSWYYKRTGFFVLSWGIDDYTDISIQSEECTSDGYRIGTRDVKYETRIEEEPEINPCRGCEDYDGEGGCLSNGGCGAKMEEEEDE